MLEPIDTAIVIQYEDIISIQTQIFKALEQDLRVSPEIFQESNSAVRITIEPIRSL